jgi:uncharacterized protein
MKITLLNRINEVEANQWNALIEDNNPFSRHEFLTALENHHCVGEQFGWIPRHIVIFDENILVGAMILYEKYNNYGEFVFDHAWHHAYQSYQLNYYPKLVSAIPYTPATGNRLLAKNQQQEIYALLLETLFEICEKNDLSSFHCLFPLKNEFELLQQQGLFTRQDCQFHWHNQNYSCFDDFLDQLRSKKRKNIRQERKKVNHSGVTLRQLNGHTASASDWQIFNHFYQRTFLEKSGMATLNLGFFMEIAQTMPDQILLVLAEINGETIAGSLMFKSDSRLYGRHWGCIEHMDYLHFETCYYQGIDYCIKHHLQVFEPGAQGEHKVARGFSPVLTQSNHYIKDDRFKAPIQHFCNEEVKHIELYMKHINQHNPYRQKT